MRRVSKPRKKEQRWSLPAPVEDFDAAFGTALDEADESTLRRELTMAGSN
jgi:hypothetical protein